MRDPVSDDEYDQARACAAAAALESSADRRLPSDVAARIWGLRHGAVALAPPSQAELERDRDIAAANGRAAWARMKQHARHARAHWRAARRAPLSAGWLYESGRAVDAESAALEALRQWNRARRMVRYLEERLSAAGTARRSSPCA